MNAFDAFLAAEPAPAATRRVASSRWDGARLREAAELVAEEVPVALSYNGITQAVMLASPLDLEDFALGFTLGERIVRNATDVYDIEVEEGERGIAIELRIAAGAMARLKRTRLARVGKTGCGLCGVDSLAWFEDEACDLQTRMQPSSQAFDAAALERAMAEMSARQQLHGLTGAVHAAGWADREGRLHCVREDVGRHNALDKLVGALARAHTLPEGFAVVTSRASYEMAQKAARAGFPLLAAISAPTALAVEMADAAGLTLAGFVRGGRHQVYTHPERLHPRGQV